MSFINTLDLNLPIDEEEISINVNEKLPIQAYQEGSLNHRQVFDLNIGMFFHHLISFQYILF